MPFINDVVASVTLVALVPWFLGSLVPWFLGSLVPWFPGHPGSLLIWARVDWIILYSKVET